ncbi:hypothetical protein BDFB_014903, partial [Asbolus verrucosus]
CASNNNITWTEIFNYIRGTEGDRLLALYGNRTNILEPKLTYVPHILFNGIFNETVEDEARNDFLSTVRIIRRDIGNFVVHMDLKNIMVTRYIHAY